MKRSVVTSAENQQFSTRRIEALSDGVFAIAMTLLVLDLKVGDLGNVTTSAQLWHTILEQQRSITSFLVSFLLLGSIWAVHMRQFEYIERTDKHLTTINTFRLLIVVLVPLTTSIAGDYSDLLLGRILLPINFLILGLVSYWQWAYATNAKNKFYSGLEPGAKRYADVRNRVVLCVSTGIVVAAIWLGEFAFILFFSLPLIMKYLEKIAKVKDTDEI